MATGPEHYREAERRLTMAWEDDRPPENVAHLVAEAQVHATLALAAATAMGLPDNDGIGMAAHECAAWDNVCGTPYAKAEGSNS